MLIFFQCACVWSYLLLPQEALNSLSLRLSLSTSLKNYKEVHALYENVTHSPLI